VAITPTSRKIAYFILCLSLRRRKLQAAYRAAFRAIRERNRHLGSAPTRQSSQQRGAFVVQKAALV
jgi:hypothetical protein